MLTEAAFATARDQQPDMTDVAASKRLAEIQRDVAKEMAGHYLNGLSLALGRADPEVAPRLV